MAAPQEPVSATPETISPSTEQDEPSLGSGSTSPNEIETLPTRGRPTFFFSSKPTRPALGTRKSSGTIIIPRDSPTVETHEQYDANDARAMSPRRSGDDIEKMGNDARQALEDQAKALQDNLLEIIERVDSVKSEHEKLEGGNKFLQSYIGELMQTSKITSSGPPRRKGTAS